MSTPPPAATEASQDEPALAASAERSGRFGGLYGGSIEHRRAQSPERIAVGSQILAPGDALVSWLAESGPLEIEIGFGHGRFLVSYASSLPAGTRMLGFEVPAKFCRAANAALERAGLTDARIVQGDARPVVASLQDASVDAIHVGFPDPWWKKRHHRRRIFTAAFIDVVARVLRPGGVVTLRTDVEAYARDVTARFDEDGRFDHDEIAEGELPSTDRELRCAEFSLRVHRHRFTRKLEGSTRT